MKTTERLPDPFMDPPRKIVTVHAPTPLSTRQFDWCAHFDDYDVDCDGEGYFSTHPIGYGATEQEAIDDLLFNAF